MSSVLFFVICNLHYKIIRRLEPWQRRLWTRNWLCRRPQSSEYATILQELDWSEYKNNLRWFFRISRQMCMCINFISGFRLVDFHQSWSELLWKRNFYLRQSSSSSFIAFKGTQFLFLSVRLWPSPIKWCLHYQSFQIRFRRIDLVKLWQSKKISNDQELIQSDPISLTLIV